MTTPGYPCFRAAPTGGLSRREGGGRDNGQKELPSDPPAVAALAQYVLGFSTSDEAQRQSALIAAADDSANWSEQLPDWADWTA